MGKMRGTVSTHDNTGLLVLAVDDEAPGLSEIKYLLESSPHIRRVLTAFDAAEALRILRGDYDPEVMERTKAGLPPVDAVFADINMPGLSGTDLARVLGAFRAPPALVFVTGVEHSEAVVAFEVGALDFVTKPINEDRINKAISRVVDRVAVTPAVTPEPVAQEPTDDEVIPVELGGTIKLVPRASVRYVEAQGDYARLHTSDGQSHLVRIPLAQLEERWENAGFVRIHRSFLVALPLVTELRMTSNGYAVVIGSGEGAKELPVSRRHTRELKERIVRPPKSSWG
ncbi:LytTR family DNA-binding domain-containing protein [Actinosynnema sp. NPDC047251]|uniref:Two-component system, response regulator of the LytTR family n=1 Tax=Saccharothrix espanaensis (strain ATCC 51144 / DSM 44229 / JCM 9112 / NBRC 15066 / NRRL 15764) TaxID=1179773 RepID=K0JNL9_SACES|nr:LytTR family DNA-binding domain-containing protein [Saccharothrix espanaensis]CCH27415.1 Two-component system, response regulator of the LytTR family [Saccharothrix espanaensis DSM 44229]